MDESGESKDREAAVWAALDQVIDPELGLPITDLGLVYRVELGGETVQVDMTTTTPICPLGVYLTQTAESKLLEIEGINYAVINTVYEPLWKPEMMSDHARQVLGIS
jgi:metal-sulfur cluster biosynthetic enzyme